MFHPCLNPQRPHGCRGKRGRTGCIQAELRGKKKSMDWGLFAAVSRCWDLTTTNSAEQAYKLTKANRTRNLIAAEKIREAKTALDCKMIGKTVSESPQWRLEAESVMEEIIDAKVSQLSEMKKLLSSSSSLRTPFMTGTGAPDWTRIKLYIPILIPGLAEMSLEKLSSNVLKNAELDRERGHNPGISARHARMRLTATEALWFSLRGAAYAGNKSKTDTGTKVGLLKSLIYDNAKATVTLDSSALKQLIQLSSDNYSSITVRRISFSVSLRSKELKLGAGQTVKYDEVLTNEGNGYDDRTGVFTCPVAGTYMFVVDSLSQPGIWLHMKVNKNAVGKLHVSSSGYNGNPLIQISRTVIVRLKPGDHVKIENASNNGVIYHDIFSGFIGTFLN
uniref:Complement C1q-like protein 3 n=1 Tax=Magallana gigas TaxID=29159 RepID=K1PFU6_MAGGI